MFSDMLELKILINKRFDKIEEMIFLSDQKEQMKKDEIIHYVEEKATKSGCSGIPVSEIFEQKEFRSLCELAKEERIKAIYNAILIGFTNGIEYAKKELKTEKTI